VPDRYYREAGDHTSVFVETAMHEQDPAFAGPKGTEREEEPAALLMAS
jgi:hypothetical protein